MRPGRYLGLSIAVLAALAASAAKQPIDRAQVLSVETSLVVLPVTVVDRRGRVVTGLTKDDFTVYDNNEPQAIQLFASEDVPWTVGLVIDSSSSMRGQREAITAAGSVFVSLSHPQDELFTVNFNEAVWPGLPPPALFAQSPEQLLRALSAAPVQGMTALYDALEAALRHLDLGTHDRKALIVVSDGGDNASTSTLETVAEHARRSNASIYGVVLSDRDNPDARPGVLKKLARENGGAAFTPKTVDDLVKAFEQIAREIRSGYTIGFSPTPARTADFRALRVLVGAGDGRRLVARTRAGYYPGRSAGASR
jgi:Ca-activated chloride channel family protein